MILTPETLYQLTGYKQPAAQVRALKRMGIRHRVRPDGRPVVTEAALDGQESQQVGPDFEAIR